MSSISDYPLLEGKVRSYIKELGLTFRFSTETEDFADTPRRVVQSWQSFFEVPKPEMKTFPTRNKQGMILFRRHLLWGFCPHHLLPVRYIIHIGYIPSDRVLGGSKPLRLAEWAISKMPLQEDIPFTVVDELEKAVNPKGAGCIVEGEHHCMRIRGIKSPCVDMVTDYLTGCFLAEGPTREEFMKLCLK